MNSCFLPRALGTATVLLAATTLSRAADLSANYNAAFDRCTHVLKYGESFGNNEPTKLDAIHALGLLADERAVPLLADYLENSPNEAVRLEATRALGWIASPAAVPALEKALKDSYPYVRERAAGALKKITGKSYDYDRTGLPDPEKMRAFIREQAAHRTGGP